MQDRRSWLLNLGRTGSMQGAISEAKAADSNLRCPVTAGVGRIGIGAVQQARTRPLNPPPPVWFPPAGGARADMRL